MGGIIEELKKDKDFKEKYYNTDLNVDSPRKIPEVLRFTAEMIESYWKDTELYENDKETGDKWLKVAESLKASATHIETKIL